MKNTSKWSFFISLSTPPSSTRWQSILKSIKHETACSTIPQVLLQVEEWIMLELDKKKRLLDAVSSPVVFILFFEQGWEREECSKLWKWSLFSVFSQVIPLPRVFRQVKDWLIIKTAWNDKSTRVVVFPAGFFLFWFYDQDWLGRDFKNMKNDHFLVFLAM